MSRSGRVALRPLFAVSNQSFLKQLLFPIQVPLAAGDNRQSFFRCRVRAVRKFSFGLHGFAQASGRFSFSSSLPPSNSKGITSSGHNFVVNIGLDDRIKKDSSNSFQVISCHELKNSSRLCISSAVRTLVKCNSRRICSPIPYCC